MFFGPVNSCYYHLYGVFLVESIFKRNEQLQTIKNPCRLWPVVFPLRRCSEGAHHSSQDDFQSRDGELAEVRVLHCLVFGGEAGETGKSVNEVAVLHWIHLKKVVHVCLQRVERSMCDMRVVKHVTFYNLDFFFPRGHRASYGWGMSRQQAGADLWVMLGGSGRHSAWGGGLAEMWRYARNVAQIYFVVSIFAISPKIKLMAGVYQLFH